MKQTRRHATIVWIVVALYSPCARAQVVTEFDVPTQNAVPEGVSAGPDGNLWFTELFGRKIGRVTPSGTITEFPLPAGAGNPYGITGGPDGNVWFTEQSGFKVGRIAASGTITEFPISDDPGAITTGPDGNLWYTTTNGIGRMTPGGVSALFPVAGSPVAIVAGPDGDLWFSEGSANKIGRMTTAGVVTAEFDLSTPDSLPAGIATGPDGNLWFVEVHGNAIGRITTSGSMTEFTSPGIDTPVAITNGSDGNLWFAQLYGEPIGRVSVNGAATQFSIPTEGGQPTSIARGPDGQLWFNEELGNKIGKITTGVSAAPVLSSVAPGSRAATGGTAIILSGQDFQAGLSVTLGGQLAGDVAVKTSTSISATSPSLFPGTLNDIVVINPDFGEGVLSRGFLADFLDVPQPEIFHDFIEKIFRDGITAGYGNGYYGTNDSVTRAQMAVFLLKSEHGSTYAPPPCTGIFDDVECSPTPAYAVDWIEQLYHEGITGGCLPIGNYCPDSPVRRDEMAVFLLKSEHGSDYGPPPCVGLFADVECSPTPAFAVDWIEQLFNEGITGGCLPQGNYCPGESVTRGQMSVFLVKTFDLP